jgi:hypothetical protein
MDTNALILDKEMLWLKACIEQTISSWKEEDINAPSVLLAPPPLSSEGSAYGKFVNDHDLAPEERLVLALTLAPHIRPNILNVFLESKDLQLAAKASKSEH